LACRKPSVFQQNNGLEDRLGGYVRLSISDRREAVLELVADDHSNVAIGEILGVDEAQVRRDRRSANAEPAAENANDSNGDNNNNSANAEPVNSEAQWERAKVSAEKNKQETLFRLSEAAYRGTVAWSVDDFASEVRERLADKSFRKQFQERLRIDRSNISGIKSGAKVLTDVLTQLLKDGG
jgi:DNA-binding CsgD family transcriptional regulator